MSLFNPALPGSRRYQLRSLPALEGQSVNTRVRSFFYFKSCVASVVGRVISVMFASSSIGLLLRIGW